MRIRYYCHYGHLTGYGRAARDYLAALHRVDGLELEIAALGGDAGCASPEPRYSHLDDLARQWQEPWATTPDLEIYHAPPRVLAALAGAADTPRRAKRVALTTWETMPLPDEFVVALRAYDDVIVPSEFCADLVNLALHDGVSNNLPHIIPHCFDESFWSAPAADTSFARQARGDTFRFYTIGAWGERKNSLGILRAYLHAFSKADDVQLMMLIDGADFDEIRSLIARSGIPAGELPELFVPDRTLDERELVELHGSADCFVSATRGEGWGLGLFEAAVMGRHVIAPLWGGQSDFLDDYAWARAIPFQMTPCFGAEQRVRVDDDGGRKVQVSKVSLPPGGELSTGVG